VTAQNENLHTGLINQFPAAGRIPKNPISLYSAVSPPTQGAVHLWKFVSAQREAVAIAESCRDLIAAGMNPRDILILLSNQRALSQPLMEELATAGVQAEHPKEESFIDREAGRLVYALLRIISNANDYVAHRALLGLRRGVAVGKCRQVFDAVIGANLNFRSIFYNALPGGVFTGHSLTTINHARTTCAGLAGWATSDTIAQRNAEITQFITTHFNTTEAAHWQSFIAPLPPDMNLEELLDFMRAETDVQQTHILEAVMQRLVLPVPESGVLAPRVRIMTMHGAKGLSGKVVFIPGLEEEIFPGPWRQPYPGLILEAARLLYVSITRARAACVLSLVHRRTIKGSSEVMTPSRFAPHIGGPFTPQNGCMTPAEVAQTIADCGNL
jgi:DNA helicase-2/ATP-dependent DNA helicase PcrA